VRERFGERGRRDDYVVGDVLQTERRRRTSTSRLLPRPHCPGRVPPAGAVAGRPHGPQDQVAAVDIGPGRRLVVDRHELDAMAGQAGERRHVPRTHGRVEPVRFEPGPRHGDVEPQLVEDMRCRAWSDVTAERTVDVMVDRLERVAVRITYRSAVLRSTIFNARRTFSMTYSLEVFLHFNFNILLFIK